MNFVFSLLIVSSLSVGKIQKCPCRYSDSCDIVPLQKDKKIVVGFMTDLGYSFFQSYEFYRLTTILLPLNDTVWTISQESEYLHGHFCILPTEREDTINSENTKFMKLHFHIFLFKINLLTLCIFQVIEFVNVHNTIFDYIKLRLTETQWYYKYSIMKEFYNLFKSNYILK